MNGRLQELLGKLTGIHEAAKKENRDLNDAERTDYDAAMAEIRAIKANEARAAELEALGIPVSRPDPKIGLSDKETRNYSLVRAIRAAATNDWRDAGLEREASEAISKRSGRPAQGFYVPSDWMERRDLTKGTDSAGGYTIADELQTGSFIEMLRNRMVVRQAGARVLSGLVGDILIPKQTAASTAYWVAESGAVTESQQTFGQVSLTPKTVGTFTDMSRKLLLQSSMDVERLVRDDLATVLALAIDLAALHGSGSNNQPLGIAATTGIGSVETDTTNGTTLDWGDIVKLETEIAQDNADVGSLAYITNAKVRGKLKTTYRVATYGDIPIWIDGPQPLNGYPVHVSNQVSSTLTKGSASGTCSALFFGNWNDLLIGQWGTLDVLVDPYTGGASGTVRIVVLQDVDVTVRRAESFAACLDATTA